MGLNDDEIQALADTHFDGDAYDTPDQRSFALLCAVARHVYDQYVGSSPPLDLDDPDSAKQTGAFAGSPLGFALIEGLRENMEIDRPDGDFRWDAVFGQDKTDEARWIRLWHNAGHHKVCSPSSCGWAGQSHDQYDAASDWAIEQMIEAGHRAPSANTDTPQSYLVLAALHSPTLIR